MSETVCCVCHQPVGPEAKRLGGRAYCERHYAKVTQDRSSAWRAGLGYATLLNVHYVVASGGVNLQAGVIRIVVTALAQASFAGLTGYFLGRAKFEDEPVTGFSTSRTQELSPGRGWRPSAWRT